MQNIANGECQMPSSNSLSDFLIPNFVWFFYVKVEINFSIQSSCIRGGVCQTMLNHLHDKNPTMWHWMIRIKSGISSFGWMDQSMERRNKISFKIWYMHTRNHPWGMGIGVKPYPPSLERLDGRILGVANVERVHKLRFVRGGPAAYPTGLHVVVVFVVVVIGRWMIPTRHFVFRHNSLSHTEMAPPLPRSHPVNKQKNKTREAGRLSTQTQSLLWFYGSQLLILPCRQAAERRIRRYGLCLGGLLFVARKIMDGLTRIGRKRVTTRRY